MTSQSQSHEARRFRLSPAWLRVPLGVAGAMALALATYAAFGPLSDARDWQLAGVHDAGVSGAARAAIRLGAEPAPAGRLVAGAAKPNAERAAAVHGAELVDSAS